MRLGHLLRFHLLFLLVSRDDQDVGLDVDRDGDHEEAGALREELALLQVNVSLLPETVLEDGEKTRIRVSIRILNSYLLIYAEPTSWRCDEMENVGVKSNQFHRIWTIYKYGGLGHFSYSLGHSRCIIPDKRRRSAKSHDDNKIEEKEEHHLAPRGKSYSVTLFHLPVVSEVAAKGRTIRSP